MLLSARNTWTLYDVDIRSGGTRWRLGGSTELQAGPGAQFYWQHDAEFQPGGLMSLFDNGSDPPKEKQSRGLVLAPDPASHTVSVCKQFTNPSKTLLASSQGNMLSLPGGDWLMGYGGLPNFTEYDASGHVLLDGRSARTSQDFRSYLSPWSGQAAGTPARRGQLRRERAVASASWNGATNVASWRLLAGARAGTLSAVTSVPKSGFQTTIAAPAGAGPYVAVQALDASGTCWRCPPRQSRAGRPQAASRLAEASRSATRRAGSTRCAAPPGCRCPRADAPPGVQGILRSGPPIGPPGLSPRSSSRRRRSVAATAALRAVEK